jgi:hypothetical protein
MRFVEVLFRLGDDTYCIYSLTEIKYTYFPQDIVITYAVSHDAYCYVSFNWNLFK